jgi:hypothetical protein
MKPNAIKQKKAMEYASEFCLHVGYLKDREGDYSLCIIVPFPYRSKQGLKESLIAREFLDAQIYEHPVELREYKCRK